MAESRIVPYLLYAEVADALTFLSEAFGFVETLRMPADDGSVNHAEMDIPGGGHIMLGDPGKDYRSPRELGSVTQLQYVVVDDAGAHFAQAKAAGATIIDELEDKPYGARAYLAADPEGHQWSFNQPLG